MSPAEYQKLTRRKAMGRRVRTLQTLYGLDFALAAGSTATITDKWGGFDIKGDPCPHCGIAVSISMVPAAHLDLLPERIGDDA